MTATEQRLLEELAEAEEKARANLSRYKFWMFGYWCAVWVRLNRIAGTKRPNPFQCLVDVARQRRFHHGA